MKEQSQSKLYTEGNKLFLLENYNRGAEFCSYALNLTVRQVKSIARFFHIKYCRPKPFHIKYRHYLYRHIRLDKSEPFYIGIGTIREGKSFKGSHSRAYTNHTRNPIWTNIVVKTDYKVQILFTSNNYQQIKNKEIEFIRLHGRKDLKTGSLANLTDGGDGNLGWIATPQFKEYCRQRQKLKTGKDNPSSIKVYVYSNITGQFIKEFASYTEASQFFEISSTMISKSIKRGKSTKAILCFDSFQGEKVNIIESKQKHGYKIEQYSLEGVLLSTFDSIQDAANKNGLPHHCVQAGVCRNGVHNKTSGGFYWRYESAEPFEIPRTKCRNQDRIKIENRNDNTVTYYENLYDASDKLNLSTQKITWRCNRNKWFIKGACSGQRWSYVRRIELQIE